MKKTTSLILLIFLAWVGRTAAVAYAQEAGAPESTEQPDTSRVSLTVSADDSVTARIVRNVMSSDLFPGYVIVEEEWDYLIDVVAFQIDPETGPGAGIAMSVLTLQPNTNKMLTQKAELLPDTVYTVINHCSFHMVPELDHFAGKCESADPFLKQDFNLIGLDLIKWKYSPPEEGAD